MTTAEHADRGPSDSESPTRAGWLAYFAGNPVGANLLMLLILIGGIAAGSRLVVEDYPQFDLRRVTVRVVSPGASPREVEEDIVRRIEESVIGLPGVDRVVSTSREGLGTIEIELTTFANEDQVLDDVQQAVDGLENFPPLGAEQPEVELVQLNLEAITLAVSSAVLDETDLRHAAEDVRRELLQLPSTSRVDLGGTRDREISIELSEEELRRHGLSLGGVAHTVRSVSLNLTSGELRTEAGGVVLHTIAKRTQGAEFADIPLLTHLDGTLVTLGDVATIRDAFVDGEVLAKVDGVPSVFVRVAHTEGRSVIGMADEVRDWRAGYEAPRDVDVAVWSDRARPLLRQLASLARVGILGVIFVFLLLVLVFDLRAALWITVGIPISFAGALVFFGPADLTLNVGTMLGLFLAIGLVVDDALVVGESIAAERELGKAPLEAAVAGIKAVVSPITVAAVTTVLAFAPFYFITEPRYAVVRVLLPVVFFVLAVSLLEAVFILPAHLGHAGRWSLWPLGAVQARVCAWLDELRDRTVVPAVSWSMRNIPITLLCAAMVVVVPVLLLRFEAVRVILTVALSSDSVDVELSMPAGTPFEATRAVAEEAAAAARTVNERMPGEPVGAVSVVVGRPMGWPLTGKSPTASHLAGVRAHLNERPLRRSSPAEVARAWEQALGPVPQLEKIEFRSAPLRVNPQVSYALKHADEEVLAQTAARMRSFMADIPGITQIADTLGAGKRHLRVELTPAGRSAGLTPLAVGQQLRANYQGVEVQRIQRGHEEIKVMVRYPPDRRASLRELDQERIHRLDGSEVPLSTVANLSESREQATRLRINGAQTVQMDAYVDSEVVTPEQARHEIEGELVPALLEAYPGLRIELAEGARETRDMLQLLVLLVPIVLIAMYVLMATFLRSYWKPLVAVVGFPIAFAGAVLGHWILGWDFNVMSLFGVIAIFGVVVNDALVLMDRYNTIRRENPMLPAIAAAAGAARHRFRAVFLTSATTVVGLSPLLYERTDELIFIVPFIVSMLGGMVLSGLFILFVLPSLVMIVEGREE